MFNQRLLFFTGKGGVGKTLTSAAFGLNCATKGERTLWVEMTEQSQGQHLFPNYSPTYEPQELEQNFWAMHLQFLPAIQEYLHIIFKLRWLSHRIANNHLLQIFTAALPGVYALVTLGKIWYDAGLTKRPNDTDNNELIWDRIIIDAPATGHGLSWFQLPSAARQIIKAGPIADRTKDIENMLSDKQHTGVVVVSLLEKLVVDETKELIEHLHSETPLSVQGLLLNKVFPTIESTQEQRERLQRWLTGELDSRIDAALNDYSDASRELIAWYQHWIDEQQSLSPELHQMNIPGFQLPWQPETSDIALLQSLRQIMATHPGENHEGNSHD